jgi:hypothetical protein
VSFPLILTILSPVRCVEAELKGTSHTPMVLQHGDTEPGFESRQSGSLLSYLAPLLLPLALPWGMTSLALWSNSPAKFLTSVKGQLKKYKSCQKQLWHKPLKFWFLTFFHSSVHPSIHPPIHSSIHRPIHLLNKHSPAPGPCGSPHLWRWQL